MTPYAAFVLALVATPAPAQTDAPTVTWSTTSSYGANALGKGLCADSAGDLTVVGGELRDTFSVNSVVHRGFVRALERDTGVERWRHVVVDGERTLAVAVDATAARVFAIVRTEPAGVVPGTEHLLALDGATGTVLYDVQQPLGSNQSISFSDVDALVLSNDGTRLYRLDFHGTFTTAQVVVRAYDAATGVLLWTNTRTGLDPFEYRLSNESGSLAISPDDQSVYASFETVDLTGFDFADTHVVALDAATGNQKWVRALGAPNFDDRVSRPVVASDSSAVFVATNDFSATPAGGPLLRLDAATGGTQWGSPIDFIPYAIELSPNGAQVVVGGWTGGGGFPNGTDAALQAYDSATGTSSWSVSFPTANYTEDLVDLVYSPAGDRIHASVVRNSMTAFTTEVGIFSAASSNGGNPWTQTVDATTTGFIDHHWLDAVALSPTGSRVSMGETVEDFANELGFGNDERRAFDGDTGAPAWSLVASDSVPYHSDGAHRVWLANNDQEALVWVHAQPVGGIQTFRLERRAVASGALLGTFEVQDLQTFTPYFKPNVSADGAYVAIERTSATGRLLSIFEIATGNLVAERNFGFVVSEVLTRFDPNSSRLHYVTRGSALYAGVYDAATGQQVWERLFPSVQFSGGSISMGLAIHPTTGDQVVSYEQLSTLFGNPSTNVIVASAANTGTPLWSFASLNTNTSRDRRDHRSLSTLTPSAPYEYLTTLTFSADGSKVFATDSYFAGAARVSRMAGFDFATGTLVSIDSTVDAPGQSGRTLDHVVSRDGRFVHVLSEGRGALSNSPLRVLVTTYDATTGARLWQSFLSGDNATARRIESLGLGGRVAVLATFDTTSAPATGGYFAVLDAENGVELWRHTFVDAERGELSDFAVAQDGTVVLVGSTTVAPGDTDVLVRRLDPQVLQQGPDTISLSAGGTAELHLDFPSARAGNVHVVVGSFSGTSPGLGLSGGFVLPLNYDPYTDYTLFVANSPLFVNSIGVLDARGDTRARRVVPVGSPAVFAGLPFTHAALCFDPLGGVVTAVSNAVPLTFVP
jgi:outer membrane protein assembly factor BamB